MIYCRCKPCWAQGAGHSPTAGPREPPAAALGLSDAKFWKVQRDMGEKPGWAGCARWRLDSVSVLEQPSQLYWQILLIMKQGKKTDESRKKTNNNGRIEISYFGKHLLSNYCVPDLDRTLPTRHRVRAGTKTSTVLPAWSLWSEREQKPYKQRDLFCGDSLICKRESLKEKFFLARRDEKGPVSIHSH